MNSKDITAYGIIAHSTLIERPSDMPPRPIPSDMPND